MHLGKENVDHVQLVYISWGGRKAGTITTQGGSACFKQQAEVPTDC